MGKYAKTRKRFIHTTMKTQTFQKGSITITVKQISTICIPKEYSIAMDDELYPSNGLDCRWVEFFLCGVCTRTFQYFNHLIVILTTEKILHGLYRPCKPSISRPFDHVESKVALTMTMKPKIFRKVQCGFSSLALMQSRNSEAMAP